MRVATGWTPYHPSPLSSSRSKDLGLTKETFDPEMNA
jgi:hypothetical protein